MDRRFSFLALPIGTVGVILVGACLHLVARHESNQREKVAGPNVPAALETKTTPTATARVTDSRRDRLVEQITSLRKLLGNYSPPSFEEILRRHYADLVPNLSRAQYAEFVALMHRRAGLVTGRDEGLKNGAYQSYPEAQTGLVQKAKELDQDLMKLLGPEMFVRYQDDNALAILGRETLVEAGMIGRHSEPMTPAQIGQLKYAFLDAFKITHTETEIYFDPDSFQYSAAQSVSHLLKRAQVNRVVVAEAKNYLSENQVRELENLLKLQTRVGLQSALTRPGKID